jgi:hypothetical protein
VRTSDFGPFILLDQWSMNIDCCYPMLRIVELSDGTTALHQNQGFYWTSVGTPENPGEFAVALADRIDFYRDICRIEDAEAERRELILGPIKPLSNLFSSLRCDCAKCSRPRSPKRNKITKTKEGKQ